MTVPRSRRSIGKLKVVVKAQEIVGYTFNVCRNEKRFPKSQRWLLTKPILDEALGIFTDCRKANSIVVKTKEDYIARRAFQIDARARSEALLSLIEIAYKVLTSVSPDTVEIWTGHVVEFESLLDPWTRSDYERYRALLE